MEECICSYLPDCQNKKEDSQSENAIVCAYAEDLTTEDAESSFNDSEQNSEELILECNGSTDFSSDDLKTDNHNECREIEFITFESTTDIGSIGEASKVLAIETKNWIMGKKLVKAEAEVECLQQALRSQWDIRSQLYANIQELKTKKQNLMQEMQNNFREHVSERNRLIKEITDIRQRLLLVNQCLSLTESKNIELEIERKDTAKCLSKSWKLAEHGKSSLSKNAKRNSSTTVNSDSDTSSSSSKTTTETKSTSSSSVYPMSPRLEPRNYASSIRSTTTTDIESGNSENDERPLSVSNKEVRNAKSLKSKDPPSNHISLDLSFLDKDTPNHIDSGFSEANNLASKNSVDSCSASRFDYAVIFN